MTTPDHSLDLDRWRAVYGFHPYHFFGLANTLVPVTAECPSLVREFPWQNVNAVGRADVRELIRRAETDFAFHANYWPRPTWITETVRITEAHPRIIRLSYGKILALGQAVDTSLGVVSLLYSDEDGDGVTDTAQLNLTVPSGTTVSELLVQTTSVDGPEKTVRPSSIVLNSATSATLTFASPTLVKPSLERRVVQPNSGWNPNTLPPDPNSPYVEQVEVTRRVTTDDDTTPAAIAVWHRDNCCTPEPENSRITVQIRNADLGYVTLSGCSWDWQQCSLWPREVQISYLSGVPLQADGQYDDDTAEVVSWLSGARLPRRLCACDRANAELYRMQQDLAQQGNTDEIFAQPIDADNPFGSRRGAVMAWRYLVDRSLQRGVTLR